MFLEEHVNLGVVDLGLIKLNFGEMSVAGGFNSIFTCLILYGVKSALLKPAVLFC